MGNRQYSNQLFAIIILCDHNDGAGPVLYALLVLVVFTLPKKGLLITGGDAPAGRCATVVSSGRRAAIACPHQSVQRVITECLVIRLAASAHRGYSGGEVDHVANVVVGTCLVRRSDCYCDLVVEKDASSQSRKWLFNVEVK
jgi:hypothetical protein